jgi:hypothetical protein
MTSTGHGCPVVLGLVCLATGCLHDSPPAPPTTLSDGSRARPPRVAFDDVDGPTVATRVRAFRSNAVDAGSAVAKCLGWSGRSEGLVVERTDVRGTTVTYLGPGGRAVYACDRSGNGSTTVEPWCGRAFGRLEDGRLRDPRLDLICRDENGEPLAFAWVQPSSAAAYVVVAHRVHNEAYPVVGRVPVRIAGDDVDIASSRATFAISEHAADGRQLRYYELEAAVSG